MTTFNRPYIRDELRIDAKVQQFYNSCTGDGPVVLLGRVVEHETTLRVHRQPLIIVADVYDGTGGSIDARGSNSVAFGAPGANGAYPWPSYDAVTGAPTGPGGDGGQGGDGGPGGDGVAVTVYCRRSINASVGSIGGIGASGGVGGSGGRGVDGFTVPDAVVWVDDTPDDLSNFSGHEEVIPGHTVDGTPGGSGGVGGTGGTGGNGGTISFTSIVDDGAPVLDVSGGPGGTGGPGGAAGVDGALSPSEAAVGPPGSEGAFGAEGRATHTNVSEADYIAGLRSVLDMPGVSYANHWAPYRIWVGDHYYHRYNASIPERSGFSRDAAVEFARALELQPDNSDALRLQAQLVGVRQEVGAGDFTWVGGGSNALGLPPDLDVQPNVDADLDAFMQASTLVVNFLSLAMQALVESVTVDNLANLANFNKQQAIQARDNLSADVEIAIAEKRSASEEVDRVQDLLDRTTAEIHAALTDMEQTELDFGQVAIKIAAVAAAVVSVAAAIPSGGTSLVALVPSMVALADTAIQHSGPIAEHVFQGKDTNLKAVKEAYGKVDKEVDAIVKAGKSIVNFVEVVEKLNATRTPDNSRHLALVTRGVDLTHQVLLARNKVALAQQRVDAGQVKVARATRVAAEAEQLTKVIQGDAASLRRTALATAGVVQSKAEALLGMAFRAQRSVEIITLETVEQHLLLDAGLLSPDDARRFEEGELGVPDLVAKLQEAWLRLLEPIAIRQRYTDFVAKPHGHDRVRLSFRAQDPQLGELVGDRRFGFRIEATDIPSGHHDAKVTGVRLALVGAAHPAGEVSCDVRHGRIYEQRRKDGTVDARQLDPQVSSRFAELQRLGGDGGPGFDPAPPAAGSLAFWGRGVGGDWEVSVPGSRLNAALDLSGLSEIQVWVGYRFLR